VPPVPPEPALPPLPPVPELQLGLDTTTLLAALKLDESVE
jgi:hypothetical protein